MASALIVEGGAMRSVFSAGVLDGFLAQQFNPFDFYIGVSAGAFNLVSYLAGQSGHSLRMFMKFALDERFIRYGRFLRGGHLLDLDWLVSSTLLDSQQHIDRALSEAKPFLIGLTDVATGAAKYIKPNPANFASCIKATVALPLVYRDFPLVDGRAMTDGGVADGIPVAEAIRRGAKRIMVIRSRHQHYRKQDTLGHRYIRWRLRAYSELVATMRRRVQIHADTLQLIQQPPPDVTIVEVCPPPDFTSGRFSRSRQRLQAGYQTGFDLAQTAIQEWLSHA